MYVCLRVCLCVCVCSVREGVIHGDGTQMGLCCTGGPWAPGSGAVPRPVMAEVTLG